ncbi:adenylate cyclase type 10-like isoform X2 [Acanthaster planci]|uniref:Adenylate cyclase type 10-like isoform X2 n=1 Tax=Acanthaster planci TaxID=133434 RepID=A0A8B7XI15_ACAPL|nr:adenylate cyclase type 10-like isoform X2 [Acanthaster planci]
MKRKDDAQQELVAHLPNVVIDAARGLKHLPAVQKLNGVLMFLDISGFTALCEQFSLQNHGVDELTKTLNDYLGRIEDLVLKAGGDVVEFAGDAMLVLWEAPSVESRVTAVVKAIVCSRKVMKTCNNWDTEVGVKLGVKIGLSAGEVLLTYVGTKSFRLFSSSGQAMLDVNAAEKYCDKGTIILAPSAWALCPERKGINVEKLDEGHVRVLNIRKTWAESELTKESTPQEQQKPKAMDEFPSFRKVNMKNVHKHDLRPFIAAPVLHKLEENQPMEYLCEMRDVTVVFINLSLDHGHDHSRSLQGVFDKISTAVLQFQGVINKIFEFDKGTSFLVLFGLPGFKHEDEVGHALQCSSQIIMTLNDMIEVRQVSVGVTTGKVFCGVVGHPERHEYTVIGPKVNMAARLMMNYPGKLSCDEETRHRSFLGTAHFHDLPEITLKGMDNPGPISEYIEADVGKDHSIPEAKHAILGYVAEFLEALNTLDKVCVSSDYRHPLFLVVKGEPGVGKTRFLRSVIDAAVKNDMRILCHRPSISSAGNPYTTACYVIAELLELGGISSPQEREQVLEDRFEGTELFNSLSLLNNLLGIQLTAHESVFNLSPAERTRALQRLLGRIVQGTQLDSYSGTLIAIDDAQYVDRDSWGYLRYFAGYSCLFVLGMGALRRSEGALEGPLVPEGMDKVLNSPLCVHVKLEGLEPVNMEALLCQFLEVASVPRELTNLLASRLTGQINPSWVKQCVTNLLHHQLLEINTEGRQPHCNVAEGVRLIDLEIPASLNGCMVSFIDRLPAAERTAVKIASIIGASFNSAVLSHLMPLTPTHKVLESIGGLTSAGVFIYENGQLRFQSVTLQETAYGLLVEKQRRKLHERYAVYLEQRFLGFAKKKKKSFSLRKKKSRMVQERKLGGSGEMTLQVIYPQLVTHWRKAGNQTKTVEYLIHAAESAVSLGSTMQAISFIYQAKGMLPTQDQVVHLDALAAQATTSLFLTREKRKHISVNKQRWQLAAAKALRASREAASKDGIKAKQPSKPVDLYHAKPVVAPRLPAAVSQEAPIEQEELRRRDWPVVAMTASATVLLFLTLYYTLVIM